VSHNEIPCIAILKKQKCLFFKNGGQEGKTGAFWELVAVEGGGYEERVQEGEYDGNMYSCMKMEK
jgi:hypothetical protein